MKFEHVNFNEVFWKGKSKEEFVAHEGHHGLTQQQLEEAFLLMNPQTKEEVEEFKELVSKDSDE